MTLSTQFGSPVSSRRTVWASAVGVFTFALLKGSGKSAFDSLMISAFMAGFTSCIPLDFTPLEQVVQ